jgi:hypothetical protein
MLRLQATSSRFESLRAASSRFEPLQAASSPFYYLQVLKGLGLLVINMI